MARAKGKRRRNQGGQRLGSAWRKWIIPVVVVLGVLALVVPTVLPGLVGSPAPADSGAAAEDAGKSSANTDQAQPAGSLAVGAIAPGFSLQDTDGNTVSLESLAGKPVLIAFMAPWCPHCQDEAPRLVQIHAQYGERVHVISVSATPYGKDYRGPDYEEGKKPITVDDLTWFQEEFGVTYPLLFDPDVQVGPAYDIQSFPTTYFLDADLRIVEVFRGGHPVADFQRVLDGILGAE